jgi:hypothetical protein
MASEVVLFTKLRTAPDDREILDPISERASPYQPPSPGTPPF